MAYTVCIWALSTVANIKTFIGESSSTYDDLLGLLLDTATDWIEEYCGNRRLMGDTTSNGALISTTEYYDGKPTIQLKQFPVVSITSVSYASGDLDNPTWNALDPKTQFVVNKTTGQLKLLISVPIATQNIKVVYTGGYVGTAAAGAVLRPKNLELACLKMVAKEFNRRKSQGITNESIGGGSIAWDQDLDPSVKKILDGYKRFSF